MYSIPLHYVHFSITPYTSVAALAPLLSTLGCNEISVAPGWNVSDLFMITYNAYRTFFVLLRTTLILIEKLL